MNIKKIEPGPNQESVWDYPRPPKVEDTDKHIEVFFNDILIADSTDVKRVLETSSPPVYYIPTEDIEMRYFLKSERRSFCEWKGATCYYTIKVHDKTVHDAAWYYPNPAPSFESIKNYIAIYSENMDTCFVDGEIVQSQAGNFYGGWITSDIVGPFKGEPGTEGW